MIGCASAIAALALAFAVALGLTLDVDTRLLLAFRDAQDHARSIGPAWTAETLRDVSALGSNALLGPVCILTAGWLAARGRMREAGMMLAAYSGALALAYGVKVVVLRPRPDIVPALAEVFTLSFPSSHALCSSSVYGMAAVLRARLSRARGEGAFAAAVALLLASSAGVSRVWLGVHFPSDVLAGWLIGTAWLSVLVVLAPARAE